ncbi:hypothetical protein O1611_g3660 [Lasiodiplodia mahajangana]|uniref:Uncharacterized protein n=1 Tax=Lasiodiplodia mahajangana TaxID=1108764 RepID=A0ACC2JRB2_9PEZI|nr:hypothetical protein O1611_g3660 [Lasiodiplodia mahajangana]
MEALPGTKLAAETDCTQEANGEQRGSVAQNRSTGVEGAAVQASAYPSTCLHSYLTTSYLPIYYLLSSTATTTFYPSCSFLITVPTYHRLQSPSAKDRKPKIRMSVVQVPATTPNSSMETSASPTSTTSSGDESQTTPEKMPRHVPPSKGPSFKRPEVDLSAMLNVEQMKQLQVIMIAIMDEIQVQIREGFDKMTITPVESTEGITAPPAVVLSVPNPASEKYRSQYGDIGIPVERPDFEDRDALLQIMRSHPVTHNTTKPKPTLTIPKSPDEATANSKRTEIDLAMASLTELKRDALGHFGKWRGLVFKRLQEVVIKNGGTGGHVVRQGPQHAPGNARRGGFAARGSSTRLAVPLMTGDASNAQHIQDYPPMYTALCKLPKEKRALILHTMLLMLLGLDQYPTYSRIALIKLATAMEVPTYVLLQDEYRVSQALAQIIKGISAEEVAQKRAEEGKPTKRWRSNGNNNNGGPGISDVLAEPLVAMGVGTVFGGIGVSTSVTATLLAGIGAADSTVAVGTLFGLYGARQGGKTMDAYAKDIQDFALIPMHGFPQSELLDPKDVPAENRRMRVTIGISGWCTEENDFQYPWKAFGRLNEVYALRWELEALSKFGAALQTVMKSSAWSAAKRDPAWQNVFTSLKTSHWPEALIKTSKVMDNPWTIAMVRAEKTGLVLAEILNNKVQGERAVSLVGYGLGARVIYACLTSLSEKRAFGIVENVILFGAPCPSEIRVWTAMKSVVTGRLINVYSKNDYLLGFLYRTCAWNFGIAGLQPIEGVPRVENVDLSDCINNHLHYPYHIGNVLLRLRWEDADLGEINKELPKRSLVMREGRSLAPGRRDGISPELREKNGNVVKEPRIGQNQRDRAVPKQANGSKDRFVTKQLSGKTKQTWNQGGHHVHSHTEQDSPKARHKQNRMDNQRPMGTYRHGGYQV